MLTIGALGWAVGAVIVLCFFAAARRQQMSVHEFERALQRDAGIPQR